MSLQAKVIVEASVEKPALAYELCDVCGEKQHDRFIQIRPLQGVIERIRLCGKCANRLVWILPRLVELLAQPGN